MAQGASDHSAALFYGMLKKYIIILAHCSVFKRWASSVQRVTKPHQNIRTDGAKHWLWLAQIGARWYLFAMAQSDVFTRDGVVSVKIAL